MNLRYMKAKFQLLVMAPKSHLKNLESMKRKQSIMTIYLTVFSAVVYLVEFSANLIIFFYPKDPTLLYAIEFAICFLIVFKQIMNFVFFYSFNTNFKNFFKNTFNSNLTF